MGENKEYVTQIDELGNIHISEEVLAVIAAAAAQEVEGVSGIAAGSKDILGKKNNPARGVHIQVADEQVQVELAVLIRYGCAVVDVAKAVQEAVCTNIESMTGLKVTGVNISVSGVSFEKEPPRQAQ